jgi:hypothetical protein
MKFIITESQNTFLRRKVYIDKKLEYYLSPSILDFFFERLGGTKISFDDFRNTIAFAIAGSIANESIGDISSDEFITLRNQLQRMISNHYYEDFKIAYENFK